MTRGRRLVAANWKMHTDAAEARALAAAVRDRALDVDADVVLCPPFPLLAVVGEVIANAPIFLGAQNCSQHERGAYTGEVSVAMLASVGCTHVIVGHSERRQFFHEDDVLVAAKTKRALDGGLVPIVCVGETLAEREAGETEAVVARQLGAVLDALSGDEWSRVEIAYEPVWAIGTGLVATPDQAQAVHAFVRSRLPGRDVRILYGGSVKPDNAAGFLAQPDVDGFLVGGASLSADSFVPIVEAAARKR